ncbi:WD40/YVTN/BNR-like repeat-containing protein [Pseudarthrobacter sp. So.54]
MLTHPRRRRHGLGHPLKADGERIPPEGKLAVHRTDDAGASWKRLDAGLPQAEFNSILRDAACVDAAEPAGVYFGTRGGSVYASADEGEHFTEVVSHLPDVLCIRAAAVSPVSAPGAMAAGTAGRA